MKAVILAAGKSTRLLPLTKETPQSLLKIKNKTILEIQLDALAKSGIREVVVVTGYLSSKIEKFAKGKDINVLFNPFYSVSGILTTLWVVREELKEGFVLLYSDILFDKSILMGILKNKDDICLAIKSGNAREEAEKVLEEEGIIFKLSKGELKNGGCAEFIGMAKFTKNGAALLINEMNEIVKTSLDASIIDAIQGLIDKGCKIYSYSVGSAKWADIDFKRDLKLAKGLFS